MADKKSRDNRLNAIRNLNTVTKATRARTYGVSTDPAETLRNGLNDYMERILKDDSDKKVINSRSTRSRVLASKNASPKDIYDIIKDKDVINSITDLVSGENIKFSQMLKDYEMVKRCIPQVHKVITTIKNNIISPDAMADSAIGIKYGTSVEDSYKEKINKLIDTYELNSKLEEWIMEWLIASVKYVCVVPYSEIPDLLERPLEKAKSMDECIQLLTEEIGITEPKSLYDYGKPFDSLNESVTIGENSNDTSLSGIDADAINEAAKEILQGIEFVRGGKEYYKKAILNEAIYISKNLEEEDDVSMKKVIKKLKDQSDEDDKKYKDFMKNTVSDGFIDSKKAKEIRKRCNIKGAYLEELPPSKVVPFKIRDTIVGYFYIEDKYDNSNSSYTNNVSTILDRINSSVYNKNGADKVNDAAKVQNALVKTITDKLLAAVDYKFINDNMKDIDIIYAFIKEHALCRDKKKIVFFHPDDICEFKRKDGSIMKNCMFYAKLYILTLLSNVIANASRGADRNLYYVKTGLTTDIEGSVNSTIKAIKQNQIRFSDMGTINEIFNLVGSAVDVFMPVSVDGERPIDTDVISGQNVDMNSDFLQWLVRSIIQSFGVPSAVVDDLENVDFARTITMSNIDMAKATLNSQNEFVPVLTKLFRSIISYEYPEFTHVNEVDVVLNPPSTIITDMNRERIDGVSGVADTLSQIILGPEGESEYDKRIRMFKYEYLKTNVTTIDWSEIQDIVDKAEIKAKEEIQKEKVTANSDMGGDTGGGYGGY